MYFRGLYHYKAPPGMLRYGISPKKTKLSYSGAVTCFSVVLGWMAYSGGFTRVPGEKLEPAGPPVTAVKVWKVRC